MSLLKKLWNLLGSRKFSLFIFVMALTYTAFLLIFALVVPQWWVNNISHLLSFKVMYGLFFINLLVCEIKWLPVVFRRCRKALFPTHTGELHRFRLAGSVASGDDRLGGIEKSLKKRGYLVSKPDDKYGAAGEGNNGVTENFVLLHAQRGRFSPLGNILFHFSFFFIAAGIFFSLFYRFEGTLHLTEGQRFDGTYGEYSRLEAAPYSTFVAQPFQVDDIVPQFWGGRLLFTDLVARLRFPEGTADARLSQPASLTRGHINIEGISYAVTYKLHETNGGEVGTGVVNLANFAPGSEDSFTIPGLPFKISISIYPDAILRGSRLSTQTMNLNNPVFFVKVTQGKRVIFSGPLIPAARLPLGELHISFHDILYNGTFRIINDPGLWGIWAAFILMGLGLVWRLLFYRRELVLVREGDDIALYTYSEYYPRLFGEKWRVIAEAGGR